MEKIKSILKNKYFWLVLIMITGYFVIIFAVVLNNKEGYLVISNISTLSCTKNDKCEKVEHDNITDSKNPFDVYVESKNIGEYKLDYISKWNFFDLNGNWQNVEDGFIAASTDADLTIKDFNTREMNAEEISLLNKLLKENNISYYTELGENEVVEYDFDKNNKTDKIIIASNITDESSDEKLFTIIISVVKNKAKIVAIDINNQYENFSAPAYKIKGIINLFNNKYDYLVITKGYFSEIGESTSYIYKLNGKTFENIIRN